MLIRNSATIEVDGQDIAIEIQDLGLMETKQLAISPKPTFSPVGYCIYCESTRDLSDEHIVPYGLSGDAVIPKASCAVCARETCRFEQLVLRGPMRAARIHRRLKSRTKHKEGPDTQRLTMIRESGEFTVDLPLSEYPILLHFLVFAQPGYLTGQASPGIRLQGIQTVLFGPRPEEVVRNHGARGLRFPPTKEQPTAFARMLAKIAYGYAFAGGYLSLIDGPSSVLSCIRGLSDDVGQWVFTDDRHTVTYPGILHHVSLHEMDRMLVAEVHLFADSQTPRYGVILGKLKES